MARLVLGRTARRSTDRAERLRPLRVELVAGTGGLGGAERYALTLLDRVAPRFEVSLASLGDSGLLAPARDRGWTTARHGGGTRPWNALADAWWLARRWRAERPDVVVANGVRAASSAVPAGALVGTPVVWVKHDFSYDGLVSRVLGRVANAVVATSAAVAVATHRSDALVLPPPRPDEPLSRVDARERLSAAGVVLDRGLVAAAVGRLVPYKGFDDVLRALAHDDAAGWQLVVMGTDDPADPGETDRLTRLAAELGVADRVALLGDVPDAGRLLSAADAVVVPTRVEGGHGREGHGMVADEALVAGVPLVVTTGGPLADRVAAAAIAVAPGAPGELAGALGRLRDDARRSELGTAARGLGAGLRDVDETSRIFASLLAAVPARPGAGLTDGPPVSVVVPVHNEMAELTELLARLGGLVRDDDQLLLVEGGSTDGTAERLRAGSGRHEVVTVPPGCGPAAARNAGIASARHEVVACTDAGCEPVPGWLDALRTAFAEAPQPALVTGVYGVRARGPIEAAAEISCYPDIRESRAGSLFARVYGRLLGRRFEARLPTGRSVAFTRTAWESVGGFPEHLRTGEDVTFGTSIAETGARVLLSADAAVVWDQRPTLRDSAVMYYRYGVGDGQSRDVRLVVRNLVRLAAYVAAPVLVLLRGWIGVGLVALGALAYLSLPLARVVRERRSPLVALFLPVALAVKDASKALGCLRGLVARRTSAPEGR